MSKLFKSLIIRLVVNDFISVSQARSKIEEETGYAISWREFLICLIKKAGY